MKVEGKVITIQNISGNSGNSTHCLTDLIDCKVSINLDKQQADQVSNIIHAVIVNYIDDPDKLTINNYRCKLT